MKNTFAFLLAGLSISVSAFGQVKIAPEAGITIFNQFERQKDPYSHATNVNATSFLPGFRAGINADITVTGNFSLQAGLFYVMNRTGESYSSSFVDTLAVEKKERLMIHYLQLPVYALYESGASGCGRFFVGAGPTFEYAIGGNIKTSVERTQGTLTQTVKTVQNMKIGAHASDYIKPFVFGLGATIGYEFPDGAYIRSGFNYGLTNLKPDGSENNSIRNIGISLSLGFYINNGMGKGW